MVAVAVFSASLADLLDADGAALHGWSFEAAVIAPEDADPESFGSEVRARIPSDVGDVSTVRIVYVAIEGQETEVYAFDVSPPAVHPSLRSGRAPRADDEIALGADTAREVGAGLGDAVHVMAPGGEHDLTVVGIAAYPELGNQGDVGHAASVTSAMADELGAAARGAGALVRLARDTDPAVLEELGALGDVVTPFRGSRLRQLDEVGSLPSALGVFLAVLGIAAIWHGLARGVADRRRELSVLRCIGFRPRDVHSSIAWQAVTTAVVGGAVGVVAGLVAGRAAWSRVADRAAVVVHIDVPVLIVASVVPAVLVLSLALARRATASFTRRSPVDGLQAE